MKVFKFGGASVRSAEAVKNVAEILTSYVKDPAVIVISAMGKTTNALEDVLHAYWNGKDHKPHLQAIRTYHKEIMDGLFPDDTAPIYDEVENYLLALELYFEKKLERNFDYLYDQVVSYGELISTRIVSAYLNQSGFRNKWVDARNFIITDDLFREARIDWETTTGLISGRIKDMLEHLPVITQGFVGSTKDNVTTTLGREGSDFTASIFAHALHAEEVVIWKDVPGILNADPRKFENTVKFDELSYMEAIEMTYYGATVLHPKTIKPIQNLNIPLNVRSFVKPDEAGTIIRADIPIRTDVPIIILKTNQILISLSTRDFSFIAEQNIEDIFDEVVRFGIKVNVMTNSAISFQMCVDGMGQKVENFINSLEPEFDVHRQEGLELLTVKHYNTPTLDTLLKNRDIVLEMKSGPAIQFVLRQESA